MFKISSSFLSHKIQFFFFRYGCKILKNKTKLNYRQDDDSLEDNKLYFFIIYVINKPRAKCERSLKTLINLCAFLVFHLCH